MRRLIFALGMLVLCSTAHAATLDADAAIAFVIDHFEGTALVADDCGKGPIKFGINQAAHPDIDVPHLTRAQAVQIYRVRYWRAIGADQLAENIRLAAFDTAVNMGVARARQMLRRADGDAEALVRMRVLWHSALLMVSPKVYRPYAGAWAYRDKIIAAHAGFNVAEHMDEWRKLFLDVVGAAHH